MFLSSSSVCTCNWTRSEERNIFLRQLIQSVFLFNVQVAGANRSTDFQYFFLSVSGFLFIRNLARQDVFAYLINLLPRQWSNESSSSSSTCHSIRIYIFRWLDFVFFFFSLSAGSCSRSSHTHDNHCEDGEAFSIDFLLHASIVYSKPWWKFVFFSPSSLWIFFHFCIARASCSFSLSFFPLALPLARHLVGNSDPIYFMCKMFDKLQTFWMRNSCKIFWNPGEMSADNECEHFLNKKANSRRRRGEWDCERERKKRQQNHL